MNAETPPDPSPESNEQAASSSPARALRIKIGSQREGETTIVPQAEPETDQVNAAIAVGETDVAPEIPDEATDMAQEQRTSFPPPRIQKSSPELEAEIESALADVSIDDILGQETSSGDGIAELEADSRHTATVVKVHRDDVFFSLPGRHEGVASSKQLEQPPEPGTAMEVVVTGFNAEDGLYELRIPGTASSVGDWSDLSEGLVVEARITGHNTGGLECEVGSIRGFIPVSQISLYRVEDLEQFKDQKLQCVVTEANPVRRNLVLSHRAVLEREKEEARQKLMASLEVGQTHEGVVRNIREFGAFVDIGGVDGLIHISQLSWDRIQDPREVLEEGQTVKVKIDKIDPQTGKLSFSYRDLTEHPWDNIQAKYPVNSIVSGTVSKIMDFGAFVKLEAGVEGLVHVSELAHHRVHRVSNVVSEGQQVEVKVLSTDRDSQRMSLSIKAVQAAAPPTEKEDEPAEDDSPTPETYKAKRNAPLKGGTNQSAGGEQFGLNW